MVYVGTWLGMKHACRAWVCVHVSQQRGCMGMRVPDCMYVRPWWYKPVCICRCEHEQKTNLCTVRATCWDLCMRLWGSRAQRNPQRMGCWWLEVFPLLQDNWAGCHEENWFKSLHACFCPGIWGWLGSLQGALDGLKPACHPVPRLEIQPRP